MAKSKKSKSSIRNKSYGRRTQIPKRASRRLYASNDYFSEFSALPMQKIQMKHVVRYPTPRLPEALKFVPNSAKFKRIYNSLTDFGLNHKIKICYGRAVRREVIHATGKAGSRVRPPKYTAKSAVKC